MKDGHTDSYYYQMISFIRRFKGVRQPLPPSAPPAISIDGRFSDWDKVTPAYRDTIGDTAHRNHKGYGTTHYTNTTGRNDFIASKVACDKENVYFFIQTNAAITPPTDANWMLLFIDTDQNCQTGWQGYDYLVNHQVIDAKTTTLKHTDKGWRWRPTAQIPYRKNKTKLELMIPRSALGFNRPGPLAFDFHWADNLQKENDITEFSLSGDSAPNRRFNYRFASP